MNYNILVNICKQQYKKTDGARTYNVRLDVILILHLNTLYLLYLLLKIVSIYFVERDNTISILNFSFHSTSFAWNHIIWLQLFCVISFFRL